MDQPISEFSTNHKDQLADRGAGQEVVPLACRPANIRFQAACDASPNRHLNAVDYVLRQSDLSLLDCIDIFLLDQGRRWANNNPLRTEVYLQVLELRSSQLPDELALMLIEHEFQLRYELLRSDSQSLLDDFLTRFPKFAVQLAEKFRATPPQAQMVPTYLVMPREHSTDEPGETCSGNPVDAEVTIIELEDESNQSLGDSSYQQSAKSLLGATKTFSVLPPTLVAKIEVQMQPQSFEPGEYLMRQNAVGDGLFVITDGQVEIQKSDDAGEVHKLATSGPGEVLGEMSLLTEDKRLASVVAVTPVTALFLPAPAFEQFVSDYPVVSRVLTHLLAERLGQNGRDALAGETLNNYRIMHRLGKGGMAIVYKAENVLTQQPVALKMMSHRLVYDAHALKLFQREARLIESFEHPNIVRMYGRFQAFRSFFIVMEFCEGVSLDEILRQKGPLDEVTFRKVMSQVASALTYAHSRQVVHRDIKPSNIMFAQSGLLKLMDFGLANPIEDMPGGKRAIAGTPQFMAPEQLRGEVVDERADYFALGCTAYKLLTGRPLFYQRTFPTLRRAHATFRLHPLPGISQEINDFLAICLQKNPEDRDLDLAAISQWET